jgi:hypothetical protein
MVVSASFENQEQHVNSVTARDALVCLLSVDCVPLLLLLLTFSRMLLYLSKTCQVERREHPDQLQRLLQATRKQERASFQCAVSSVMNMNCY